MIKCQAQKLVMMMIMWIFQLTDLTCGEDLTSGWQRIVGNGCKLNLFISNNVFKNIAATVAPCAAHSTSITFLGVTGYYLIDAMLSALVPSGYNL